MILAVVALFFLFFKGGVGTETGAGAGAGATETDDVDGIVVTERRDREDREDRPRA